MGTIRRNFKYLNYQTLKTIFCAHVRIYLEYANLFWSPNRKKDIVLIESVQKKATKFLPGMIGLTYEQRLRKINLPTLSYRRLRDPWLRLTKYLTPTTKNLLHTFN